MLLGPQMPKLPLCCGFGKTNFQPCQGKLLTGAVGAEDQ